ncbi:MAG TPA: FAA hydrolase family protein [Candidatus Acetothermia bacterium]|nr:FAA hydrolase family protein [Candidatus Acetothermia bacterium]HEX32681.1 FAA hydrolase family protein [Candidatus Acetothermia bacterium]
MRLVRFLDPASGLPMDGRLEGEVIVSESVSIPVEQARLLAPCEPTKIVCVGRNYAAHAAELGNEVPQRPLLFFKPPSAVIGPNDEIVLPKSNLIHHEAELAVVIGTRCRNVSADEAMSVVLGYTCMNDVSDREAQKWDKNWVRAKGFDTSAPLGPAIVTKDEIEGPFHVMSRVNGEIRQDGSTADFIFTIPELIEEITHYMTLEPGDVIATGTPAGVGPLVSGDAVEIEIEEIGILRNRVR